MMTDLGRIFDSLCWEELHWISAHLLQFYNNSKQVAILSRLKERRLHVRKTIFLIPSCVQIFKLESSYLMKTIIFLCDSIAQFVRCVSEVSGNSDRMIDAQLMIIVVVCINVLLFSSFLQQCPLIFHLYERHISSGENVFLLDNMKWLVADCQSTQSFCSKWLYWSNYSIFFMKFDIFAHCHKSSVWTTSFLILSFHIISFHFST